MRKTRIDEFPQFLNVLKGDMAVVGPRPERPFVKEISEVMPFYETRHIIKPGLLAGHRSIIHMVHQLMIALNAIRPVLYQTQKLLSGFEYCVKTITTVLFYRGQ
jgi:lipopolysaccharide/colanic/teichoic acid biosynthesis glycosyltransferase